MNVPKLNDLDIVLKIYHENITIGNKEIVKIFKPNKGNEIGYVTVSKLKKMVTNHMKENKIMRYSNFEVPTKIAFECWGINIKEVERLHKKRKELEL